MNRLRRQVFGWVLAGLVTAHASAGHATGSYQFCPYWYYWYVDMEYGEDYLANSASPWEPAQGAWVEVFRNEDYANPLWYGYLSSGVACTGYVPALPGSYQVWLSTSFRTLNGAYIDVYPGAWDENWHWYLSWHDLPGLSGGNQTLNSYHNSDDLEGMVSAVMSRFVSESYWDPRFVPGASHIAYAQQAYPGTDKPAYDFVADRIYLGGSVAWIPGAYWKHIIAHETGHSILAKQMGSFTTSHGYGNDEGGEVCQCGFVTGGIGDHCFQSKEFSVEAQTEGFGHFTAADIFNNNGGTDAIFNYYKETCNAAPCTPESGNVNSPPVGIYAFPYAFRWMETRCTGSASGKGVEFDWLLYYYKINNKTADQFTVQDISDVYKQACGGWCSQADVQWSQLSTAVGQLSFPIAKRDYWRQQGTVFGVAH